MVLVINHIINQKNLDTYKNHTSINFSAFKRTGTSEYDIETIYLENSDDKIDVSPKFISENLKYCSSIKEYIFKKKENAQKVIDILIEKEILKLKKFNEENGTNHKYPY